MLTGVQALHAVATLLLRLVWVLLLCPSRPS